MAINSMAAGEFKNKCLAVLDEINESRGRLLITKRGKPVGMLVPPPERSEDLAADLKNSVSYEGDLLSPIDVDWEVSPSADEG